MYLVEQTLSILRIESGCLFFQRRNYVWSMWVEDVDVLTTSELQTLMALCDGLCDLIGVKSTLEVLHADQYLGIDRKSHLCGPDLAEETLRGSHVCGGIQGRRVEPNYACFFQRLQEFNDSSLTYKLFTKATTAKYELRCRVRCLHRCDSDGLTKGGDSDGGWVSCSNANETEGSG